MDKIQYIKGVEMLEKEFVVNQKFIGLAVLILILILLIIVKISLKVNDSYKRCFFIVAILCFLFISLGDISKLSCFSDKTYRVRIDDSINMEKFTEKYEIVDCVDGEYIVRQKK